MSTHRRAPPAKGDQPIKTGGQLTRAPVGTSPTTGQASSHFLTLTVSSSNVTVAYGMSEVSSMCTNGERSWSPLVRRVVFCSAPAEVSEVGVRRCNVSFLHLAFLSAVLCPSASPLFLTVLYGLCCDYDVTGDCLTVCLLFPSCCICARTCSRTCPEQTLPKECLGNSAGIASWGSVVFVVGLPLSCLRNGATS